MNTTSKGNEFRDKVAALLRAAGFIVTTEPRSLHKKVDILATKTDYGRQRKVAVECKNYATALTKKQSIEIIIDYKPLVERREVDEVWTVAKNISSDARMHLEGDPRFRIFTFEEFRYIFADFASYLDYLTSLFEAERIKEYYVPICDSQKLDLEAYIEQWIASPDSQPIAIEAGYGKGKTTFSLYLTNKLAERFKQDPLGRIPIYVPLGEISTEQSVSGLISNVLAKSPLVSNYSFHLIEALNKEGCFVIIFDGFDEMKHGLTYDQFKYNFSELLKLNVPSSKIIMLGRPTAFLSENERSFILHGVDRTISGQIFRDKTWPKFKTFDISDWSVDNAKLFVKTYFPVAAIKYEANLDVDTQARQIATISSGKYDELIVRPVHAKMLVEIALDESEILADLSTYHLYDRFIHAILKREVEKRGRDRSISMKQRRQFAAEIAWWMWRQSGLRSAKVEKIPNEIFLKYKSSKYEQGDGDLKRELIAGCFVDKNDLMAIYFPHRTFQEFLVAEYIVDSQYLDFDLDKLSESVVPLINDFIVARAGREGAALFIERSFQFVGAMGSSILRLIADFNKAYALISERDFQNSPWFTYAKLADMAKVGSEKMDFDAAIAVLEGLAFAGLDSRRDVDIATLHFFTWLAAQGSQPVNSRIMLIILKRLMRGTSVLQMSKSLSSAKSREQVLVDASELNVTGGLLLASKFEIVRGPQNKQRIEFPLGELNETLQSALKPKYVVRDFSIDRRVTVAVELEAVYRDDSIAKDIDLWRVYFRRSDLRNKIVVRGDIFPRPKESILLPGFIDDEEASDEEDDADDESLEDAEDDKDEGF